MENISKIRGPLQSSNPSTGGANIRSLPVFGIVKNNIDPIRSGRLQVYISDFSGNDSDNAENWVTVSLMTPFYGYVQGSGPNDGFGDFVSNPASYGLWNSPPDIGTTVICIFINGDMNYGYYIGCVPEPQALRMVPAIGANFGDQGEKVIFNAGEAEKLGGATKVLVTNMNINDENKAFSAEFLTTAKPVHSFQSSILFKQGLLRDPIRGPITSSSQRETPSRVGWGISTPGRPIYEGGFDDASLLQNLDSADSKQLKVISRRGGHSIVMDDGDIIGRDQLIRIRTALGHQILMSDDGQTLFIVHSNGQSYIELGKEGTIDMYSTNSVNVRTQGDLNLHADRNININAVKNLNIQADNIQINSENEVKQKAGTDYKIYTKGTHTHKVDGPMSLSSDGDSSFASSATTFINGSKINLNTGQTGTTPEQVPAIDFMAHTDTLYDSNRGFLAAPGKLLSIVSRAPAHTPWANAGQGVDAEANLSADANLPAEAGSDVTDVTDIAKTMSGVDTTSVPLTSTVPPVNAASKALDANSTSALVSDLAVQAQTNPLNTAAIAEGAGVVNGPNGKTAVVGAFAQTPKQLDGTITKPGSTALVDRLVKSGKDVTQAMTSNLFTGKGGPSLDSFTQNLNKQVDSTVGTLQKAQASLVAAGAMTGKEGPAAIGGVISSVASNGLQQTLDVTKSLAGKAGGAVGGLVSGSLNSLQGAANSVMKSINGGSFATSLADNVTSGLAGISKSLTSAKEGAQKLLDNAQGVAASAFKAISKGLKSFKPGVPVDVKATVEQAAQSPSALASGLSVLPGGEGVASSISKNGKIELPGADSVKSLVDTNTTALTNKINFGSALTAGATFVGSAVGKSLVGQLGGSPADKVLGKVGAAIGAGAGASIAKLLTSDGTPNLNASAALSESGDKAKEALGKLGGGNPLDKLKSGKGSLTDLLGSALPKDASAVLNTGLAALGSGGSPGIKMPQVSEGTNKTDTTGALKSVLGDSRIPLPNFTGSPPKADDLEARMQKKKQEQEAKAAALKELQEKGDESTKAMNAYNTAVQTLPPGDPEIARLKSEWEEKMKIKEKLFLEYFTKYP